MKGGWRAMSIHRESHHELPEHLLALDDSALLGGLVAVVDEDGQQHGKDRRVDAEVLQALLEVRGPVAAW